MKQLHHWPKSVLQYIKEDIKLYICILVSFLIGGVLAAVFAFTMPALSCEELLLYLNDFFQNISKQGADSTALFKTCLSLNLQNFGLLFLCSVMVIGVPFIAAFAAVRGFMHCFTLFFMFRLYGFRALLFFIAGMLPHYLLLVPCYLLLCVTCLKFSLSLTQSKQELKKNLFMFICRLAGLFVLAVMAGLLQSYVEPLLIRLIAGVYLSS